MSPVVVSCYQCLNAVNILPVLVVQANDAQGDIPTHVEAGDCYYVLEVAWLIWGVEIWWPTEG